MHGRMSSELVPIPWRDLARAGLRYLPAAIGRAGEAAAWRFIEFFAATIRNKNTELLTREAVAQFFAWCEKHRVRTLPKMKPIVIAAYIEKHPGAAPTVKQHLAAIRMLFDFLVTGQIVPMNPAASVRGPKHVVKRGKTPVLTADQARTLLDSIKTDSIVGPPRSSAHRTHVLHVRARLGDGQHANRRLLRKRKALVDTAPRKRRQAA